MVLRQYNDAYALTAFTYTMGAVFVTLSAVVTLPPSAWVLSPTSFYIAIYAAVFCSAFNFYILGWANKYVGPGTTALYLPLQPLGTAVIGYISMDAVIRSGTALGASLIFMGLFCVVLTQDKGESVDKDDTSKKYEMISVLRGPSPNGSTPIRVRTTSTSGFSLES